MSTKRRSTFSGRQATAILLRLPLLIATVTFCQLVVSSGNSAIIYRPTTTWRIAFVVLIEGDDMRTGGSCSADEPLTLIFPKRTVSFPPMVLPT